MKKLSNIILALCIAISAFSYANSTFAENKVPVKSTTIQTTTQQAVCIKPIDLVNNVPKYLHKKVCMESRFSKFSTLGLDYKPAFRSSEKYITIIYLREDVINNIPLSELKMFLPRKLAEKLPEVKEGDTVKIVGTVFSNALGDAWLDIESIDVIKNKK